MSDRPTHKCITCGSRVTVYSSGDGTNSYEPVAEREVIELRAEVEILKSKLSAACRLVAALAIIEPDEEEPT